MEFNKELKPQQIFRKYLHLNHHSQQIAHISNEPNDNTNFIDLTDLFDKSVFDHLDVLDPSSNSNTLTEADLLNIDKVGRWGEQFV